MKILNSKLIQKNIGKKKRKYLLTLEITDYDIEKLEDLAYCTIDDHSDNEIEDEINDKWIKKFFNLFRINAWKKFK